jgi:phosphoglycolate phosphatase
MTVKPQAIIFDWDNTLVDSWDIIQHAMNETLTAMGHEIWDLTTTKQRVALSLKNVFPRLFGESWHEAQEIFYESYESIHLEKVKPLDDRELLLMHLSKRAIPLAIVSNKKGHLLRQEIDYFGWKGFFKAIIGAGDAPQDKPAIDPVQMVLDSLNLPASHHIWFIGDMSVDMECAYKSGCYPVMLRNDYEWQEECILYPPLKHFLTSKDLINIFT